MDQPNLHYKYTHNLSSNVPKSWDIIKKEGRSCLILKKIETVVGPCYSWVYQPAFFKMSSDSVHPFSREKRTKTRPRALPTAKLTDESEIEIKLGLSSLVYKTWRFAKISIIQVMYRQNSNFIYIGGLVALYMWFSGLFLGSRQNIFYDMNMGLKRIVCRPSIICMCFLHKSSLLKNHSNNRNDNIEKLQIQYSL